MDEWHRLLHNQSVGWPLRYTFGTVTTLGYTLLPAHFRRRSIQPLYEFD